MLNLIALPDASGDIIYVNPEYVIAVEPITDGKTLRQMHRDTASLVQCENRKMYAVKLSPEETVQTLTGRPAPAIFTA